MPQIVHFLGCMFSSLMFLVLEDGLNLIISIVDNFFPHWVKVRKTVAFAVF